MRWQVRLLKIQGAPKESFANFRAGFLMCIEVYTESGVAFWVTL